MAKGIAKKGYNKGAQTVSGQAAISEWKDAKTQTAAMSRAKNRPYVYKPVDMGGGVSF